MLEWTLRRLRRMRMKTLKPFGRAPADMLQMTIGDRHEAIAAEMASAFAEMDAVEVVCGDLLDASCDAIVSPANSFGDMGGGIDKAIDDLTDGDAQRRIMAAIAEQFLGELPVGAAIVVQLSSGRWKYVVASPTMRIPGNVAGSINAYLSMRAAMVAVLKHNERRSAPIRRLAVSGLATGVGGLDPRDAAEQMRTAYEVTVGGRWRQIVHPAQAPYVMGKRHAN